MKGRGVYIGNFWLLFTVTVYAYMFFFCRSRVLLPPQPPSSSTAAKSSFSPATFQRQPNLVHIFLH
ncbi:hypothetical protein ACOSP7_005041 [Xanthoceras sorbifolium]